MGRTIFSSSYFCGDYSFSGICIRLGQCFSTFLLEWNPMETFHWLKEPHGNIPLAQGTPWNHSIGSRNPMETFHWLKEPHGNIPLAQGTPWKHSIGSRNPVETFHWLKEPHGNIPLAQGTPWKHSIGSRNPCAIWLSYTFVRCSNLEIAEPVDSKFSGAITFRGTHVKNHWVRVYCHVWCRRIVMER